MAQFRDGISFWLILSLALVFLGLTTLYAMRRQVAGRANMQLHASQSEWDKMRRECDKMRRESKKKDDELVWLRRQGKEMLDEAKTMREELVRVQGMVQKTQKRTQELEAELENIQGEKKAQARQLHLQSLDLKASEDESRVLKVQHGQALELLKSRTSELIGAEAFLTKADSLSGSDVLDMVTGLNMEASQTAAFMADSFEFRKRGEIIDDSADVIVACRHASEVIGERMVHLLRSTEHAEDPMLIQIALQSAMLCVSEWIIDAWCFQDEYRNIFLHEVYRTVQESGKILFVFGSERYSSNELRRGSSSGGQMASINTTSRPKNGSGGTSGSQANTISFCPFLCQHTRRVGLQTDPSTNSPHDHDEICGEIDRG